MKKNANAVQSKFDLMHNACNVDIIHQKATRIKPGSEDGVDSECYEHCAGSWLARWVLTDRTDDRKRYLYVSAAQMKLLVDVPEQVNVVNQTTVPYNTP